MQEYPESIIITIDDDIYYEKDMIETLVKSYKKYPYAISALRVHRIITNKFGEIMPYSNWIKEDDTALDRPAFNLIATGCGGVLYPPRCLNEIAFNKLKIIKSCIEADDLWLKVMELLNNKPVVLARKHRKINVIEDSQDLALWKENVNYRPNKDGISSYYKNEHIIAIGGVGNIEINRVTTIEELGLDNVYIPKDGVSLRVQATCDTNFEFVSQSNPIYRRPFEIEIIPRARTTNRNNGNKAIFSNFPEFCRRAKLA